MPDRISPVRMREIEYILRFPGRFTKADICDAAAELRAEVSLLHAQIQRTLSTNTDNEGTPSCPSSTTAATSAPAAPGPTA